jgi:glycosyltransferase involved in cell wall biosynthesis
MSATDQLVLAGHPYAPIGMGEHVRCAFRAFQAAGVGASVRDIFAMDSSIDPAFQRIIGPALTRALSIRTNIFHINADEVELALAHLNDEKRFAQAYNIIYPAWELSRFPDAWLPQLRRFSEVWAPSRFIYEAITSVSDLRVVHMPLAVDVTMSSFIGRRGLGLPEQAFIFLFFFDFSSYMARKNPFAVLDAFEILAARYPKTPLHLVIKHKGGAATPADEQRFKAAIAKRHNQIQVIDATLSENEVRNLVREANCFVSLHRSEGFGRGMAEAMALGVPTIATGYSGNLDFMTEENSFLVKHTLQAVEPGQYPQSEGQFWAQPDLAHAVALMERVLLDQATARSRAQQGAKDIRRLYSPLAIGLRYTERLEALAEKGLTA